MPRTATKTEIIGTAGRLHVEDGGEGGLPVLFLHAFGGVSDQWSNQLDHLRRDRRALAFDLRGHGESDAPNDPADYAVDSLADDVQAVIEGLALDRVVLVGHSLGGSVALAYAGRHPERVAGLVLAGTPGQMPEPQARQTLDAMSADYDRASTMAMDRLLEGARPDVRRRVLAASEAISSEDGLAIVRASFAFDPRPSLGRYEGPILIIDPDIGDASWAIHRLAPAARREILSDTSHWAQMDRPDAFNALLDEFLATLP
jgi:pimeloyl-ACP methyl ester carboxylesterase